MKWRLCELQLGESEMCCFFFFYFNQKQRRWKKHDEKQSLHELKAEGEAAGEGWGTGRHKQTDNY